MLHMKLTKKKKKKKEKKKKKQQQQLTMIKSFMRVHS